MQAWILFLLLAMLPAARAESAAAAFDRANRAYEQERYAEAIEAYQKLISEDGVSPTVYFNLGNAFFRNGQTGQAILSYRLAQRLAPRDPDIQANLRFARASVSGGGSKEEGRWHRWVNLLSIDEAAWLAAGVVWLWFLLLAAGQVRREWARPLRSYAIASGVAAAVAMLWLGVLAQGRLKTSTAVVIAEEAIVRYGPFEEARSSHTLRDGAELAILDRKDRWLHVTDGARRTGWLQTADVAVLPRG